MEQEQVQNSQSSQAEIYDWIQCILVALIVCVLIFVFLGRMVNVVGSSMYPTLEENDKIFISNLFYTPKQGDIVVLRKEAFMSEPIVKRVIAVGGQKIDIDFDTGIVYVDNVAMQEQYVNELTFERENFEGPVTIPEGSVFVMGDNRNASTDSRYATLGCVDTRYIMGRVYCTVFPIKNIEWNARNPY